MRGPLNFLDFVASLIHKLNTNTLENDRRKLLNLFTKISKYMNLHVQEKVIFLRKRKQIRNFMPTTTNITDFTVIVIVVQI